MFTIEEIQNYVPHRYPFLLIDRVLEFAENQSVKTLKNISINEAYFVGHFPDNPIFPGVYIIENIAQSSCFLLVKSSGRIRKDVTYYLGKVKKTTFLKPVRPGDQLITTIHVEKSVSTGAIVHGVSTVNDKIVAKGEFMFGIGS